MLRKINFFALVILSLVFLSFFAAAEEYGQGEGVTPEDVSPEGICGNGLIEGDEECDSWNLNWQTCISVTPRDPAIDYYVSGFLGCKRDCTFDFIGCIPVFKVPAEEPAAEEPEPVAEEPAPEEPPAPQPKPTPTSSRCDAACDNFSFTTGRYTCQNPSSSYSHCILGSENEYCNYGSKICHCKLQTEHADKTGETCGQIETELAQPVVPVEAEEQPEGFAPEEAEDNPDVVEPVGGPVTPEFLTGLYLEGAQQVTEGTAQYYTVADGAALTAKFSLDEDIPAGTPSVNFWQAKSSDGTTYYSTLAEAEQNLKCFTSDESSGEPSVASAFAPRRQFVEGSATTYTFESIQAGEDLFLDETSFVKYCASVFTGKEWILRDYIVVRIDVTEEGAGAEGGIFPGDVSEDSCYAETACITGENAYYKYGFDRLLFDWRWENVKKNNCDNILTTLTSDADDTANDVRKFCDATQFSISLAKKGNAIKEFVNQYKGQFNEDSLFDGVSGYEDLNAFRNTENLYRWVQEQARIKDEATGMMQLFFIAKDGSLLAETDVNMEPANAAEPLETSEFGTALDRMGAKIEAIQGIIDSDATVTELSIIGVVNSEEINDSKMEGIGAEKPAGFDKYVVTFREYKELYDRLMEDYPGYGASCEISKICACIAPGKVTITTDFLLELYNNITFYAGIRDSSNINFSNNSDMIDRILLDGNSTFDYDISKFWKENIKFESYLVKDNYASGNLYSKEKFESSYMNSDNGELDDIDFSSWTIEPSVSDNPGRHRLLLDYNWVGAGSFKLKKTASTIPLSLLGLEGQEYGKNALFYKGFNAGLDVPKNSNIILAHYAGAEMPTAAGTLSFENTFDSVKDGVVLEISENGIIYSPSSPARILLTNETEPNGIYYATTPAVSGNYMLEWEMVPFGESVPARDHLEEAATISRTCINIQTDAYGLSNINMEGGPAGEPIRGDLRALAYSPANVETSLTMLCSGNSHAVSSMEFDPDSSDNIAPTSGETTVSNNITGEATLHLNNTAMNNVYSIEKYVELIRAEKICIDASTSNSLKLKWNSNKLYALSAPEPAAPVPPVPPVVTTEGWHTEIITTRFGCGSDAGNMASGVHTASATMYAALPAPISRTGHKQIEVCNNAATPKKCIIVEILDVGPWCTGDEDYVFGAERPFAEQHPRSVLSRIPGHPGQCNSRYASNAAGLDLSCDAYTELFGSGQMNICQGSTNCGGHPCVDWRFVEEQPAPIQASPVSPAKTPGKSADSAGNISTTGDVDLREAVGNLLLEPMDEAVTAKLEELEIDADSWESICADDRVNGTWHWSGNWVGCAAMNLAGSDRILFDALVCLLPNVYGNVKDACEGAGGTFRCKSTYDFLTYTGTHFDCYFSD